MNVVELSKKLGTKNEKRIKGIDTSRKTVISNLSLDPSISDDNLRFAVGAIAKANGETIEFVNEILTGINLMPLTQKQFDGARLDIVQYK